MGDEENGQPRWRPTVPTMVVVAAVVVALVAVSALLVVLFRETVGPGEVLRDFAQRLDEGDCEGSYVLLDETVREEISEEAWCEEVPGLASHLAPDFEIDRVVLEDTGARVEVTGGDTTPADWFLSRDGRSWAVAGAGAAIDFPAGG